MRWLVDTGLPAGGYPRRGPNYHAKRQLRRKIIKIDQQIRKKTAAVTEKFEAALEAKEQEYRSLKARTGEVRSKILALRDRTTDFQALKRKADTNRGIYDSLLQRQEEAGVLSADASNKITIIDRALVPGHPFKPNLSRNLRIALLIGLIGGVLVAFLFEHLDDTIKTSQEVEERVRAPVLGVVPFVSSSKLPASGTGHISLAAAKDPRSPFAEDGRHQPCDCLCAFRGQSAADICRPALPEPASRARASQHPGTHQPLRRQHQTRRRRPTDPGRRLVRRYQRALTAEPHGAVGQCQDVRLHEPGCRKV